MESKTVDQSAIVMTQVMMPQDTNPAGNVHGGVIMKYIDNAAAVVASRHFRGNVVTVSIDHLEFLYPVYVGDVVYFKASANLAARSSMEIGVRVEAENLKTGLIRHTASAYLTFVALDEEGRPCPVPELVPKTEDQRRRLAEAAQRRRERLAKRPGRHRKAEAGGD